MSKDTKLTVEERRARQLVARICEGMTELILSSNGSPVEEVRAKMKGIMIQLTAKKEGLV